MNSIEWSDKGNYTCKSTSSPLNLTTEPKYLATQLSSTKISIIHEPVILNERFPDRALAAATIGSTVCNLDLLLIFFCFKIITF